MGPARWGLLREHAHWGISPGMVYTGTVAPTQRESCLQMQPTRGERVQPGSRVSFASCFSHSGNSLSHTSLFNSLTIVS